MDTRALPLIVAFAMGACALQPNESLSPEIQPPLVGHVWADFDQRVSFYTNRPAYVAIFEVSPYDGVGLLYPAYSAQREAISGVRWATPAPFSYRWAYLSETGNPLLASTYMGPRFIFMIASERPLRIQEMLAHPFVVRRGLGYQTFLARRPYETMDRVAALVLPDPDRYEWATDVFMVWPDEFRMQRLFVPVACGAAVLRVPVEYAALVRASCIARQARLRTQIAATPERVDATPHSLPRVTDAGSGGNADGPGKGTVADAKRVKPATGKKTAARVGPAVSDAEKAALIRSILDQARRAASYAQGESEAFALRSGLPEPDGFGRFVGPAGRGSSSYIDAHVAVSRGGGSAAGIAGGEPRGSGFYRARDGTLRARQPRPSGANRAAGSATGRTYSRPASPRGGPPARSAPPARRAPPARSAPPIRSAPPVRSAPAPRSAPPHPAPPRGSSGTGHHGHHG